MSAQGDDTTNQPRAAASAAPDLVLQSICFYMRSVPLAFVALGPRARICGEQAPSAAMREPGMTVRLTTRAQVAPVRQPTPGNDDAAVRVLEVDVSSGGDIMFSVSAWWVAAGLDVEVALRLRGAGAFLPLRQPVFHRLISLQLSECAATCSLEGVESCPSLLDLHILHCPELIDLSAVGRMSHLHSFTLESHPTTTVAWLSACRSLRYVSLRDCPMLRDCSALASLSLLESLELQSCGVVALDWLLGPGFAQSHLTALTTVMCSDNMSLENYAPLAALRGLQRLEVSQPGATLGTVVHVRSAHTLTFLSLHCSHMDGDELCAALRAAVNLRTLELSASTVLPAETVLCLAGCRAMEEVKLWSVTTIDARGWAVLAQLTHLRRLDLRWELACTLAPIGAAVELERGFAALGNLSLWGPLQDISALAALPRLEILCIGGQVLPSEETTATEGEEVGSGAAVLTAGDAPVPYQTWAGQSMHGARPPPPPPIPLRRLWLLEYDTTRYRSAGMEELTSRAATLQSVTVKCLRGLHAEDCSLDWMAGSCRLSISDLSLYFCPLGLNLAPLQALTQLVSLELESATIVDISVIAGLPQLESLSLDRCGLLSDLSPVAALTHLRELRITGCAVTTLQWIGGCEGLQELHVCHCVLLEDWGPLAQLPLLRVLSAQTSMLGNLEAKLSDCAHIRERYIFDCIDDSAPTSPTLQKRSRE